MKDTAAGAATPKAPSKSKPKAVSVSDITGLMGSLTLHPNKELIVLPATAWYEYVTGQKFVMFETHFLSGVPEDDILVECHPNRKGVIIRYTVDPSHPWLSEAFWPQINNTYGDPNHANTTSRREALQKMMELSAGRKVYIQLLPSVDGVELTGHVDLDMPLAPNNKTQDILNRNQRYALLRIQACVAEAPRSVGVRPGAPRML